MGNRTILKSYGPARLEQARAWLAGWGKGGIVLTPAKGAGDALVRVASREGPGSSGIERLSPGRLYLSLAFPLLVERERSPISRLGFEALVARVINRLAREGRFAYFGPIVEMPGFPAAVADTLEELRMNRIPAERLRGLDERSVDLAGLLEELNRELAAESLADPALIRELALERVEKEGSENLPECLVILDFAPRNQVERAILGAFSRPLEQVLAVMPEWDEEGIECLENLLGTPSRSVDPGSPEGGSSLDWCRRLLFTETRQAARPLDDSFEFVSAPGEDRECVEIARRILGLVDRGYRFDQVAVLLRDPAFYQGPLADALGSAGIPVHFAAGASQPNHQGRAFLALLDCAAEGLSPQRAGEFLTFAGYPRWDPLLDRIGRAGTAASWAARLDGLTSENGRMLSEIDSDDPLAAGLRLQAEGLTGLRGVMLPLLERLESFPDQACWGVWLDRLEELAEAALRDPVTVQELLDELGPMEAVGPVGLDEVRRVLERRLRDTRESPGSDLHGKVFAGPIEAAAGRSFEVVFLPGLGEGLFPRRIREDPILLDEPRQRLDPFLRTRQSGIQEERRLLRIAVGAAARRLCVSYPRVDLLQGRGRVPSLFALELLRAATGSFPELSDLDRRHGVETAFQLGWPAPSDPMSAIDPSEFDLARLGSLLHGDSRDLRGRGRFLLNVNPWLARSVRARYKRWQRAWSDDDGIVAPREPEVGAILSGHLLTRRSYSPTALQQFCRCPFRFFLYSILKIQPREELGAIEQIDPLVRGSLIHEAQFKFFERLEEEGIEVPGAAAGEQLMDWMDAILDEVAARSRQELQPALPGIWQQQIEEIRVDLRTWIREMASEADWKPIRREFSFGLPLQAGRDPRSSPDEVMLPNGFRVRGAVDLLEEHRLTGALRVTDHKTGRSPEPVPRQVGGGEVLQPLLYGMAVEQLFGSSGVSSRLYFCTQRGGFRKIDFSLDGDSRRAALTVIGRVNEAVERGFLPAAPREGACRNCDYMSVCGPYEELRIRRKDPLPLRELEQLRRLP